MKLFLTSIVALLATTGLLALDDQGNILALARKAFGPEKKLISIKSLYYEGRIVDPAGKANGLFKLYLRKPYHQRMEIEVDEVLTVTAINGLEGYRQMLHKPSGKSRLGILNPQQVEKIIVNTIENLFFLKGTEHRNGKIIFEGKTELQGKECYILKFQYRNNLFFERFIDLESGKILATRDERGVLVYQRGEIFSDGIRFSKSVESYLKEKHINTIHFQHIEVNKVMKDELFNFPEQPR